MPMSKIIRNAALVILTFCLGSCDTSTTKALSEADRLSLNVECKKQAEIAIALDNATADATLSSRSSLIKVGYSISDHRCYSLTGRGYSGIGDISDEQQLIDPVSGEVFAIAIVYSGNVEKNRYVISKSKAPLQLPTNYLLYSGGKATPEGFDDLRASAVSSIEYNGFVERTMSGK